MKTIVVYYSMGGNTAYAAGRIADALGADMAALAASGLLAPRSFFVAEQRARTPEPSCEGFATISARRYGRTAVTLLRFSAP